MISLSSLSSSAPTVVQFWDAKSTAAFSAAIVLRSSAVEPPRLHLLHLLGCFSPRHRNHISSLGATSNCSPHLTQLGGGGGATGAAGVAGTSGIARAAVATP